METAKQFKEARTTHNQHGHQAIKDVSRATGITGSLIEDLETEDKVFIESKKKPREVGYKKIKTLALHYGVSTDYLLGLSPTPTRDEDVDNACKCTGLSLDAMYFFEDLKDLPAEKKERILFAVNTLLSESRFSESVLFWEHIAKYLTITADKYKAFLDDKEDVFEADEVLEILLTQNNKYLHNLRAELNKAKNAKKKSRTPKKGGGNTEQGGIKK